MPIFRLISIYKQLDFTGFLNTISKITKYINMHVWKYPPNRQPWVVKLSTLGRDNPGLSNPNPNPNPKICKPWVVTTQGWRLAGYFHKYLHIYNIQTINVTYYKYSKHTDNESTVHLKVQSIFMTNLYTTQKLLWRLQITAVWRHTICVYFLIQWHIYHLHDHQLVTSFGRAHTFC